MATNSEVDALLRFKADAGEVFALFKRIGDEYKRLQELFNKVKGAGGGGTSPSSPKTPTNANAQAAAINNLTKALKQEQAALAASRAETEKVTGANARVNASYVRREVEIKNLIRQTEALSRADAKGTADQLKLASAIDRLSDRARASAAGFQSQEASMRRVSTVATGLPSKFISIANSVQNAGNSISSFGQKLSLVLTGSIVAGTYAVGKYGLSIEGLKNQLTAFEGSSVKAEQRLTALRTLVDQTAGATREGAYELYGLLKPLEVGQPVIDSTIVALGRLGLGFKNMIPKDFAYNLTQIFGQGFEEQDIKQAIGQVPNFRKYLVKAFGTDDNQTLKEMKTSGKLTMDSFLQGFADAVQKDTVLAGLKEPVALRMQKFFERAFEAVEPLANRIVEILSKAIELATPYLAQFAQWFQALSPFFQNVIIGIGAVLAALGPLLIVLGSLVSFIASLVTIIGTVGLPILAAIVGALALLTIGITAAIGVVYGLWKAWEEGWGAIASAVAIAVGSILTILSPILGLPILIGAVAVTIYKVWTENFGGIQEYTIQAWTVIRAAIEDALIFINDLVGEIGGAIIAWWRENYPLIREVVVQISDSIKSYIQGFLNSVRAFWNEHGAAIMNYVRTYWNVVKGIVSTVMAQLGGYIRLALQLIKGDWSGAWQTFLGILQKATATLIQIWTGALKLFWAAMKVLVPMVVDWLKTLWGTIVPWCSKIIAYVVYLIATLPYQLIKLVPTFVKAGMSIGSAIWQGVKEGLGLAAKQNPINVPGVNMPQDNSANIVTQDDLSGGFTVTEKQSVVSPTSGGGNTNKAKEDAEKRQKELEEIAKRDTAAQIELLQNRLEKAEKLYDDTLENLREQLEKDGDKSKFLEGANNALEKFRGEINAVTPLLENLEKQQDTADKKIASEIKVREEEQEKRRIAQGEKIQKSVDENNKSLEEAEKKKVEAEKKKTDAQIKREKDIFEVQNLFFERTTQNLEDESAERIEIWKKEAEEYKKTWTTVQSQIEIEEEAKFRNRLKIQAENLQYEIEEARKRGETVDVSQTQYINEKNEVVNITDSSQRPPNAGALVTSSSSREVAQAQIEYDKGLRALNEFLSKRGQRLDDAAEKDKKREKDLANYLAETQNEVETNQQEILKRRIDALKLEQEEDGIFFNKKRELALLEIELAMRQEEQRSKNHLAELQRKKAEIEADKGRYAELVLINQLIEAENQRHREAMGGLTEQKDETEGKTTSKTPSGFFGKINDALKQTGAWKQIGNILSSSFNSVANAVGNAVKAFVLFGSAGGSFKKFAAELIASLSQMAAVQAVFEVAMGFAALARGWFGDPKAFAEAKMHFISAAVFGAVAGVSAIAGRAVAGDSFKENQPTNSSVSSSVDGTVQNAPSNQVQGETVKFNERLGELIEVLKNRDNKLEIFIKTDEFAIVDIAARANRRNSGRQRLQNVTGIINYSLDG